MASHADFASGNQQPVCQNCSTATTPLWRRDEYGSVLCNACGLFLKLHGTSRPISLKTDVIKSRNRVRTAIPGQKRKLPNDPNGQPQTEIVTPTAPQAQMRRPSAGPSDPSNSPISRTLTPAAHSNIAPQHLFDGASLSDHGFSVSTSLPSFNIRQPSPGSTSSQHEPHNTGNKTSHDHLIKENTVLKTRVSELEVINILYKGQVGEQDQKATESEQQLRQVLEKVQREKEELKRRVEELEQEVAELRGEEPPAPKRRRTSNDPEYPDPSAAWDPSSRMSDS
ncbi:MAG: hypothetical protein LQ350_006111 [Teloschistes chrysophthalmus]|nr:MAG: hypothetical protein LQ350_006111 [Niorma chrysophthalma]